MDDLAVQVRLLLVTTTAGAVLGILFDIYRVLRGLTRPGRFLSGLEDLLFWLVATVLVIIAFVAGNFGELRLGAFVGLGLGIFLYYRILTGSVVVGTVVSLRGIGRLVVLAIYLIQLPFSYLKEMGHRFYQAIYFLKHSTKKP